MGARTLNARVPYQLIPCVTSRANFEYAAHPIRG